MKTRLIRCGIILAIATLVLSSAVLAGPGPPGPPGPGTGAPRVCAVVAALPLPGFVINVLGALFCPCVPPACD